MKKNSISNKIYCLLLLVLVSIMMPLNAQMTIGSNTPPPLYSAIEVTIPKGIHVPALSGVQQDALTANLTTAAQGLMIYSVRDGVIEIWDGTLWVKNAGTGSIVSPSGTLKVLVGDGSSAAASDVEVDVTPASISQNQMGSQNAADINKLYATDATGNGLFVDQASPVGLSNGLTYLNGKITMGGAAPVMGGLNTDVNLDMGNHTFSISNNGATPTDGYFSVGATMTSAWPATPAVGSNPTLLAVLPSTIGNDASAKLGINLPSLNSTPTTALEVNGAMSLKEISVSASSGTATILGTTIPNIGQVSIENASADYNIVVEDPSPVANTSGGQQLILVNNTNYTGTLTDVNGDNYFITPWAARELTYRYNNGVAGWQAIGARTSIASLYMGTIIIPPYSGYAAPNTYSTGDWQCTKIVQQTASARKYQELVLTYQYNGPQFDLTNLSPLVSANSPDNTSNLDVNVSRIYVYNNRTILEINVLDVSKAIAVNSSGWATQTKATVSLMNLIN